MKVLVTGANGFLGFNLVKELLNLQYTVISVSRRPLGLEHPALTSLICDLKDIDKVPILGEIDVLFHTAATVNFDNNFDGLNDITRNNILTSGYLADFVIRRGVKKLVLSSSCSVYEENFDKEVRIDESHKLRPINLYAVSKLCGEWIFQTKLENSSCKLCILRYSSIYGEGQNPRSIIPIFIKQAIARQTINIFGAGERTQDYVYINDVVKANLNCITADLPNRTILKIGSGQVVSDLVLAQQISQTWRSNASIDILRQNEISETAFTFNIDKAKELIGFQPIGLQQGLRAYRASQLSKR